MKSLGTLVMSVAVAAAMGTVVLLAMQGQAPKATPAATPADGAVTDSDGNAKSAGPFPDNLFPHDWHFPASGAAQEAALKRNIGRDAPDLTVGDFYGTGGTKRLSDLRGTPVLVDFWGAWCGPCIAAVPKMNEIADTYKGKLHVIGVHSTNQASKMNATARRLKMAYPTAPDMRNRSAGVYGVQWWPFYVLIDSQGKIRANGLRSDRVEAAVKALLAYEAGESTP